MLKRGRKPGTAKAPGSGRKLGSKNLVTREAKQSIQYVFDKLGGAERMFKFFNGDDLPSEKKITAQFENEELSRKEYLQLLRDTHDEKMGRLLVLYEKIYPKLLPVQIAGSGKEGNIVIQITREDAMA